MKKLILLLSAGVLPLSMWSQSAVDAYMLSQNDIRGTARFMSMGGAFTALGGDLSTLVQNPAGIGVYRRSEIGATLDISPRSISAKSSTDRLSTSSTPVSCNNFGYIGTVGLKGAMETFSWGASYNRVASFDRKYNVYEGSLGGSLTNYIADFTNASGYTAYDLEMDKGYNPYFQSDCDWLSILAYNTYMINDPNGRGNFRGLWQNGTRGDSYSMVRERGYVDEYAIDFGGNVSNKLMWGIGFGITDLQYNRTAYYDEALSNAYLSSNTNSMFTGEAGYGDKPGFALTNYRTISGTGFNMKFGLIYKPVNEIRVGVAFHTPTWYTLSNNAYAEVDYCYYNPDAAVGSGNPNEGYDYTEDGFYNFKLNAPWKFMVGVAGVLGSSAIISADYEYQAYNKMSVSYQGAFGDYISDNLVNGDIRDYYKGANIFRVGAEYRVTPSVSVRAGYNHTSTTATEYMRKGGEVFTAGTDPAFTMDRGINAVSVGLGYRYKAFYVDAAYVYRNKKATYKPYTDYGSVVSASAALTETTNSIVISAGVRF